ncbi:MAG: RiPP maturation radical SAM C-methyltransferase [Acidobacteriota bacterium]
MDVCLAYMPYGLIEPPPLGMALLVAEAKRAGLLAEAVYPTFWFAEKIGYLTYNSISKAIAGFQIAEWTFSSSAFPDFRPDDEAFLTRYLEWECQLDPDRYGLLFSDEEAFRSTCWSVRRAAESFIAEAAEKVLELKPKIVGCSSIYHQNCASLALLRKLKELNPALITLMGGANCEGPMGVVMKRSFPWVDFVVSGEADDLFAPFCQRLLGQGARESARSLPHGVIGAGDSAQEYAEPPVAMVKQLDALPPPDYDEYLEEREGFCYKAALPRPSLSFETSRGCWWGQKRQCTFCGVNGSKMPFRVKSPGRVINELATLRERYAVSDFIASDNIIDVSYFKTVLHELAATGTPRYSFFFELKSNMTEAQVRMLADAGVHRFQPGIESLHDELLRLLNKGTRAIDNVALLKFAHENGIRITWIMLADIPGERDEWYAEMASWLPLLAHLQPPHLTKSINFDRFSEYHRHPERYGLELMPVRWHSFVYPLSEEAIRDFAYRFEDRTRRARGTGEGRLALSRAILDWMRLYTRGDRPADSPTLTVLEKDDRSVIKDSRPCAVKKEIVLKGTAHLVHRACRSPHTMRAVADAVSSSVDTPLKPGELENAIADLLDHKILLQLGGRFLALAMREPLRPFIYPPEYKLPRLQSTIEARGKSYWDVLQDIEKRIAGRHLAGILGAAVSETADTAD